MCLGSHAGIFTNNKHSTRGRWLVGQAGTLEVWVSKLPGIPDGLAISSDGHFWVPPPSPGPNPPLCPLGCVPHCVFVHNPPWAKCLYIICPVQNPCTQSALYKMLMHNLPCIKSLCTIYPVRARKLLGAPQTGIASMKHAVVDLSTHGWLAHQWHLARGGCGTVFLALMCIALVRCQWWKLGRSSHVGEEAMTEELDEKTRWMASWRL